MARGSLASVSGVVARWGLPAALGLWCGLAATTSVAAPTQPGQLINELNAPVTCELCHGSENALPQFEDPDYTPLRTWQGTLMANAARDPVFWAGIAVADADSPGDTELCVRCHAPRAWLEGNGAATSIDQLTSDQRQGVECELCHRMEDDGVTPAGNAQYVVDDVLVGPNVPRRGPWSYPNADAVPEPPHSWIADTYLGSSRFCGTCHDVTTSAERIDDAGNGMGVPFNEQRTYSEWLNSAYAQPGPSFASCQDCHMPAVEDKPGCTAHLNQYSHATGGRRHDLVGANRFMVELLRNEYGSSGANLIADFFFDNTIAAIDEFLPTAATLEVEGPAEVDLREGLSGLAVTVTNESGHKLPSGYSEGRIMWIEVLAEYDGQPIYSSGAWDQAAGMQEDPQLRTYEARAERWSDGIEFHLLLNDHWVTDTRIPPRGLLPDLETDPVGDRYALLPDGTWPNYDQHSYEFPAADEVADATPADPDDDRLEVTVRLRYLINTPEYIDFLANEAGEAGVHVATLFDLAGGAPPVTIREQTLSIPIVGFGSVAETGTGTEGSTGSTTTAATGSADTTAGTSVGTGMGPGATTELPPGGTAATEDAEGGAADGGGEGCSCRSASGGSGPGSLVLLPWLLLGLRRRRQLAP